MQKHPIANSVVLTLVLVVLALAVFAGLASASTEPFPGLPASDPFLVGELNASDVDDYYLFGLERNQQLRVTGLTPKTIEMDLALWDASGTPAPSLTSGLAWDTQTGTTSELMYDAVDTKPTAVSLQVHRVSGSGTYGANWTIFHAPELAVECTPTTIDYGTGAEITGLMRDLYTGTPAATQTVLLWYSYDNKFWKLSGTRTSTDADGHFTMIVKPKSKTWYRVTAGGQNGVGIAIAESFWVKPRVYLSRPTTPSRVRRRAWFTCTGYLKPRHTTGGKGVKLQFERSIGGLWVRQATYSPVNRNYSSYTKYSSRVMLKQSGSWRVRAYHSSEQHASTYSSYRYFTVVR